MQKAKENINYIENFMANLGERIEVFSDIEKYKLLYLIIDRVIIDDDKKLDRHIVDIRYAISLFNESKDSESKGGKSLHFHLQYQSRRGGLVTVGGQRKGLNLR